jgi:hypothetical protein
MLCVLWPDPRRLVDRSAAATRAMCGSSPFSFKAGSPLHSSSGPQPASGRAGEAISTRPALVQARWPAGSKMPWRWASARIRFWAAVRRPTKRSRYWTGARYSWAALFGMGTVGSSPGPPSGPLGLQERAEAGGVGVIQAGQALALAEVEHRARRRGS